MVNLHKCQNDKLQNINMRLYSMIQIEWTIQIVCLAAAYHFMANNLSEKRCVYEKQWSSLGCGKWIYNNNNYS